MRTISYHKLKDKTFCIKCKTNLVPIGKAMRPCDSCLKGQTDSKGTGVVISHRQPAAVLDVNGKQVVVDKFGNEVAGHGYDLKNDPRGYNKTKTSKKTREII